MVFLSPCAWLRVRLTDRFWRKQEVLQHARHFRGRKNRCYVLAGRSVRRAMVFSTDARHIKKRYMKQIALERSRRHTPSSISRVFGLLTMGLEGPFQNSDALADQDGSGVPRARCEVAPFHQRPLQVSGRIKPEVAGRSCNLRAKDIQGPSRISQEKRRRRVTCG